MINFNRRYFPPLLFAIALPLVVLAEGAMSAHAGTVTVTGNRCGAGATATTTTPSDPSNTATAIGAQGCNGSLFFPPGGPGGAAYSTATTSINSGAASAQATSFGGYGGAGIGVHIGPRGGNGGAASSNALASSTTGSASATANSAGGRAGVGWGGNGGAASSNASASSTMGSASATANSAGGTRYAISGVSGAATASANAQHSDRATLTSASASSHGSSAKALANVSVGPGSESLVAIVAGQAVSDAILAPNGSDIGVGAMSAAYGGLGPLQYEATALFTSPKSETLYLNLLSNNFGQPGFDFDTLTLEVFLNGIEKCSQCTFTSLAGARAFFTAHPIGLGAVAAGQSITMDYLLGYKSGTSAVGGDGFGFTYDLATAPVAKALTTTAFGATSTSTIPEPSTWALMLLGFASLAFAGYRARGTRGPHKSGLPHAEPRRTIAVCAPSQAV
jgi:hypothetical protein